MTPLTCSNFYSKKVRHDSESPSIITLFVAGAGAKIASDPQEFGSLLSISLQSISVDVLEELLKVPGVSPKGQDQLAVNMVLQVWIQSFG